MEEFTTVEIIILIVILLVMIFNMLLFFTNLKQWWSKVLDKAGDKYRKLMDKILR